MVWTLAQAVRRCARILLEAVRQDILDDDAVRLLSVLSIAQGAVQLTSKRIIVDG